MAGTAAGQGVKADHSTYTGPYTRRIDLSDAAFAVGPGVAPEAKLVALKVFGCEGSTNLVVDALEWVAAYNVSHADGIDVVNMSLGAPFGANTDPDAVATNNLVDTGVVVVASAGNENPVPYITGAPAAATKAISVAALDAFPTLPLATIDLPGAGDVTGINQNAFPGLPVSGTLHVVAGPSAGLSLGCAAGEYDAATAGKIVVIRRGVCAFVDKGAAAAGGRRHRRHRRQPHRHRPAARCRRSSATTRSSSRSRWSGPPRRRHAALTAANGAAVTLASAGTQANPTYQQIADFSSSGPRWGDSWLKPDVAAPGVNILSSLNGSGWKGTTLSGTSMAAPVTAGVAALVKRRPPGLVAAARQGGDRQHRRRLGRR